MVRTAKAAAPSGSVNCFRFRMGDKTILAAPAHVAIYPKNRIWKFSSFMSDFPWQEFDWKVPAKYFSALAPEHDLAYVEVEDQGPTLDLVTQPLDLPTSVNVVHRMPFDHNAVWHEKGTWGTEEAVLYPAINESLVEAGGLGFRGLSGAAALDRRTGNCVGIFVRKAEALALKVPASAPPSPTGFQKLLQDYLGITDTLKKSDLHEVIQVVSVRRGVFITGEQIERLMHEPVVHLRDVVGTTAPEEKAM